MAVRKASQTKGGKGIEPSALDVTVSFIPSVEDIQGCAVQRKEEK